MDRWYRKSKGMFVQVHHVKPPSKKLNVSKGHFASTAIEETEIDIVIKDLIFVDSELKRYQNHPLINLFLV